jgi:hypothetical protein
LGQREAVYLALGDDYPATAGFPKVLPEQDNVLEVAGRVELLAGAAYLLPDDPAVSVAVLCDLDGPTVAVFTDEVAVALACLLAELAGRNVTVGAERY